MIMRVGNYSRKLPFNCIIVFSSHASYTDDPYPDLAKAIRSLYNGGDKYIAEHLIRNEIQHFDFYMKGVKSMSKSDVKRLARRPTSRK